MLKKRSPVIQPVTDKDIKSHTLEEILTKAYGAKGTTRRIIADEKIKEREKTFISRITLKEMREHLHKTQKQVADVMHVDHTVVSKLESNFANSQLSTILRYAKALEAKHVSITFEFANRGNRKHSQILELTP